MNQVVDDMLLLNKKYSIIHMHLGNVEDRLNVTREKLEIAKVKLKTAVSSTDHLLEFITSLEKITIAEEMRNEWPAHYCILIFALGATFGATIAVLTPVPVVAGAAAGAVLTGFYHFTDALKRQDSLQRLESEVTVLSACCWCCVCKATRMDWLLFLC